MKVLGAILIYFSISSPLAMAGDQCKSGGDTVAAQFEKHPELNDVKWRLQPKGKSWELITTNKDGSYDALYHNEQNEPCIRHFDPQASKQADPDCGEELKKKMVKDDDTGIEYYDVSGSSASGTGGSSTTNYKSAAVSLHGNDFVIFPRDENSGKIKKEAWVSVKKTATNDAGGVTWDIEGRTKDGADCSIVAKNTGDGGPKGDTTGCNGGKPQTISCRGNEQVNYGNHGTTVVQGTTDGVGSHGTTAQEAQRLENRAAAH